jgi:hypothetical protein
MLLAIRPGHLAETYAHVCFIAAPTDITTTAARFLFGSVRLTASLITIRPGHRDDAHSSGCVNAAPIDIAAMALRFFLGVVALTFLPLAIRRRSVDYDLLTVWPGNAAPTRSLTICVRSLLRIVALTSLRLAIPDTGLNDDLAVGSFHAAPTPPAMRSGFIFGIKTLQFARLRIGRAHLDWVAVETYPARFAISLMALRLFSCRITLATFFLAISRRALENFSIQATPAWQRNTTGFSRLFCCIETLPASALAIVVGGLD